MALTITERRQLGEVLRKCYDRQKSCPVFAWEFWAELLTAIEEAGSPPKIQPTPTHPFTGKESLPLGNTPKVAQVEIFTGPHWDCIKVWAGLKGSTPHSDSALCMLDLKQAIEVFKWKHN
jgi:hypothetical protein